MKVTTGPRTTRPGFQQMIANALSPEKPFDTIIVHDLSRFSRSASDFTRYRNQVEEAGGTFVERHGTCRILNVGNCQPKPRHVLNPEGTSLSKAQAHRNKLRDPASAGPLLLKPVQTAKPVSATAPHNLMTAGP